MKESPESRSRRNVEALFRELGYTPSIITEEPLQPRSDRCYIEWSDEPERLLEERMDRWDIRIKAHRPFGIVTATRGWRERRATWAAQVIEHCIPDTEEQFFEVDFDDANPDWGLALLVLHGVQWLRWKFRGYRTDPFTVARKRGWETQRNGALR